MFYQVPLPTNEPVLSYAPGSPERAALKAMLTKLQNEQIEVPMYIGGEAVYTEQRIRIKPPHDHRHTLGYYHKGDAGHVQRAIDAALKAKKDWENMPWQERAAIFLKAADLLAGPYRAKMNAATMLGQSKNAYQAEIDCVCEWADFLRFNVQFMTQMYAQQPNSPAQTWNRMEYRPLEGFVFALSPFNFTSIAGNLSGAPALMGNTVVWKASETQIYSANVIMEVFKAAGLPDGVINLVHARGAEIGNVVFQHPAFAGLHFTGGTDTFNSLWNTMAQNLPNYINYPRIVGETGGKDFVVAHGSADPEAVAVGLARGAFEYQGQKCSAASRAYIARSIWKEVMEHLLAAVASFKMGAPTDFSNFINAVIDESSFDNISGYIDDAKNAKGVDIIAGGNYDKSKGYFIEPTIILTLEPHYRTMVEEIFGPVLTIYVFDDDKYEDTLRLVDATSPYALTGAVFAQDKAAVNKAFDLLRYAAGNFYINDKPTGAVVGQQPFGGARASGTNDKAGSILNLYRWVSPRTIKENFNPPTDYRYAFMQED